MKKLSDFKGEAAIDVFADLIEPVSCIIADKEVRRIREEHRKENESLPDGEKVGLPMYKLAKPALKNHKKEIIEILAILNEKPVEQFEQEVNALQIPIMLITLLNEPEIQDLFQLQDQTIENSSASSGPATVTTEAEEN